MKLIMIGGVALLSLASFAQTSYGCNWSTESNWSCSSKTVSTNNANIVFSADWKTAKITSNSATGTFNFVSSDGKIDNYKNTGSDTLIVPSVSCGSTSGFEVTLNGEVFSCF